MSNEIPVIYARIDTGTFYHEQEVPEEVAYVPLSVAQTLAQYLSYLNDYLYLTNDQYSGDFKEKVEDLCKRVNDL